MKIRLVLYGLVGVAFVGSLLWLQWRLDLGPFAEQPQTVALAPGARAILAGGRAVLTVREIAPEKGPRRPDLQARLGLRCGDEVDTELLLEAGDTEKEHCDLWIIVREVGRDRAVFEVWWD